MCTKAEKIEAARLAQLRAFVPEAFTAGTLLYIGACPQRPPECLAALEAAGRKATILEIWPENVKHFRKQGYEVIEGDICRVAELGLEYYDMAAWFHGPEHIEQQKMAPALEALEEHAGLVVIAVPWGEYPQEEAYGNPYNKHRSAFEPEDFIRLGYRVSTIGRSGGRSFSNLLGVKP